MRTTSIGATGVRFISDSKVRDILMEVYDAEEDWTNRFREQRFVNGASISLDHSKKQPKR